MITLRKLRPYTGDIVAPSPNQGARKAPLIQGIVLHATEDEGDESLCLSWMRSPRSRVSCHLLVSRNGRVTRLVGDQQRAWHAGVARWRGTSDVNSITLGIEIANRNDGEPYTDAQYARVADIVAHYCRQGISLDDVVSHGEIASSRRKDPFGWDWDRFRAMVQQRLRPAADASPCVQVARAPEPGTHGSAGVPAVAPHAVAPAAKKRVPAIAGPKPVRYGRAGWLNGMTVLAWGGMLAAEGLDLAHRLGMTLPKDLTKWAMFAVALLNIILRWRTMRPIAFGQAAEPAPDEAPAEHAHEPPVVTRETRPQAGRRLASALRTNRGIQGERAL